MANPWDHQQRESVWLLPEATLPCPRCGRMTDSLKQYRYVSRVLCYLIDFTYETTYYRGCPSCIRRLIARRVAWTMIPGNVVWLMLALPWGIGLIVASFRKGHSQDVIQQISPEMAAAIDSAGGEFSLGRVLAIVAILCCWFPLFGLLVSTLAYFMNGKSLDWRRTVSRIALGVSGLVHV